MSAAPYPLTDPDTSAVSWRGSNGELVTVRALTRDNTEFGPPISTVEIAGHEVSVWDARMIGSYLTDLYRALGR